MNASETLSLERASYLAFRFFIRVYNQLAPPSRRRAVASDATAHFIDNLPLEDADDREELNDLFLSNADRWVTVRSSKGARRNQYGAIRTKSDMRSEMRSVRV